MLSVITITFNNFTELQETLGSIPLKDIESVVINGGKCEKTVQFLKSNSTLRSLSERDHGISDAFNKGFRLSTGEYVTFLNSGDRLIDSEYYPEAISYLDSNPNVNFVYADICFIDQFASSIHVKSNMSLPHMPFLHPTLIVRRETMQKIGLFDINLRVAMDLDFVYRLIKSGSRGHYIQRMVVEMDGRGISSTNFLKTYKENFKVIVKNDDFNIKSIKFLTWYGIKLMFKLLLLKFGGRKFLSLYRKKRYQIK